MPNVALVLKSEIARVARKEVRGETLPLKKAVSAYRSEIAALKRRAQSIEQLLRRLTRGQTKHQPTASVAETANGKVRFSAKSLASQRRRLGLSAEQCGLLLGASSQSVYNWEQGKTRPRVQHLAAIAAMRGMGKREVAARLEAVQR
jgi:DNA-binding transcriptional regulator YiaG